MAAKTKSAKGDVASYLKSIGWTLDHEDPGSEGEAGVGWREAAYSARCDRTGFDVTMGSIELLLNAVSEYEEVSRPV